MLRNLNLVLYVWSIIIGGVILFIPGRPPVPINTLIGVITVLLGAAGLVVGLRNRT